MRTYKSANPLDRLVGPSGHLSPPQRPAPVTPSSVHAAEYKSKAHGGARAPAEAHSTPGDGGPEVTNLFADSDSVAVGNHAEPGNAGAEARGEDGGPVGGDGAGLISASATAATTDQPENGPASLERLTPAIERAYTFAERWAAPYRPEIFRVALGKLLGHVGAAGVASGIADGTDPRVHAGRSHAAPGRGHIAGGSTAAVGGVSAPVGQRIAGWPLGPMEKLARALGVDADAVERTVHIAENGQISVLGHLAGKTRKELQTRYSLVYLYVKEMALGNRLVDIEELRALCVEHGCYDQANFTGNYKKDVTAGLIREDGGKGTRARRYMLSQKGVAEGNALLRALVEQ